MENQKSELLSSNAKRQKVDMAESGSQNLTHTILSQEAMEGDKLERERNMLTDLNTLFPELVWEAVLKKIDSKEHIEQCTNSSPYFRHLLARQRESKVVLPQVFKIVGNHFFKTNVDDAEFYNCRMVCQSWNKAIEEIHQEKTAGHYYMHNDFKEAKYTYHIGLSQDFLDESQVQKFVNHFEATHFDLDSEKSKKCPFLGRSVSISCDDEENIESFYETMLESIRRWGEEVWYFKFDIKCFEDYIEFVAPYQKIMQFVEHMPNLRVLRIHFDKEEYFEYDSDEELQDFIQEISRNPFPKLTKLEFILTDGMPDPFFNHLILQNQQISQLSAEHQEFGANWSILFKGLPNLTQLRLDICSDEDFELFEKSDFGLKLSKMHFIFHDFEEYQRNDVDNSVPFVSWSRVLAALEKKFASGSCTELYLKLPTPNTDAERKSALQDSLLCRLKFPNVQLITIWQATVISLDFLLPLKTSLDRIKLIRGRNYEKDNSEFRKNQVRERHFQEMLLIKFLGFESHLQDSNISTIFPRLKSVVVTDLERNVTYSCELDGIKRNWYSPYSGFDDDLDNKTREAI